MPEQENRPPQGDRELAEWLAKTNQQYEVYLKLTSAASVALFAAATTTADPHTGTLPALVIQTDN